MSRQWIAEVAFDARTAGSEAVYLYAAHPGVRPGQAHVVTLGARSAISLVTRVSEVEEIDLPFPAERLKPLGAHLEELDLPETTLDLVRFVADEYLCPLSVALAPAMPPQSGFLLSARWSLIQPDATADSPALAAALAKLRSAGGSLVDSAHRPLPRPLREALTALRRRGAVERTWFLADLPTGRKAPPRLRLTADAEAIERFLDREGARKPRQAVALMALRGLEGRSLALSEVQALTGASVSVLNALRAEGLLVEEERQAAASEPGIEPNADQARAIAAIESALGRASSFLLYGVTGSGKTEVYLRVASRVLRQGRQVLYLVPEIALSVHVLGLLRERFGSAVAVMHSALPSRERLDNWRRIRSGQASLIVGARSALFAPFADLGLVVVDEEHEPSYKQGMAPRYHGKRLAAWLSERWRCPLVLGSATPSIETFADARAGRHVLLELPRRASAAQLPTIHVEDLTVGYRRSAPTLFGDTLKTKLAETFAAGNQALLFLNRRAYAPILLCRDCGRSFYCPDCAVPLAYHRAGRFLLCHHCGHRRAPPESCPNCGGTRLHPLGVGSQRVEEALRQLFPDVPIARLDRDIAARKGAVEGILARFRAREILALVGTQLIAKGLDFPHVTLVGVVAADLSLALPDFRAAERTFQLLVQVAGRAGRSHVAGEVVVQTFNPDHPAIRFACAHDYLAFFEHELAERAETSYPPFSRLVNVIVAGPEEEVVAAHVETVARTLADRAPEAKLLGPVACPLARLQGLWRKHVLLKLAPGAPLDAVRDALASLDLPRPLRLTVDVDPLDLF